MMRYLCNSPKKNNDRDHSIWMALGNGMRAEVWKEFLHRFGYLKIYEFYGATEGNAAFINYTGKVGAVGRINFFNKNIFFPYFYLDLLYLFSGLRLVWRRNQRFRCTPPFTLLDSFLEKVQKLPEKPLILFGEEVYSFRDIDRLSSQVARVFQGHMGLKEGEIVAVFLKNIPAYIWIWMGLEKIGCTMACVNYNIRSKSLLDVFSSCEAKVLLTTPEFQAAIEDVLPTLKNEGVKVCYLSDDSPTEGVEALLGKINSSSAEPVPASFRANVTPESPSLYIFTSGTTGLPKPVIINHKKVYLGSHLLFQCGASSKDVVYTPLPLYHAAAILIGVAGCIEIALGKSQSPQPLPDKWLKLINFLLLKYDVDQDKVVRDDNGHCIPVAIGKTGLMVTKITKAAPFVGYAGDPQKSEKKILRDVLEKGDSYFNSGDLLMQDHEGFLYFQDRVGDTFRWKAENVATTEVERTLAMLDYILEVNVYGVSIPGHEGRIGMAAVRLKDGLSFDGKKLYTLAKDYMPNYAIPRFIRLKESLEVTGTFKQCKSQLVKEGFDPAIISDPLYFLDDIEKCYVPMTQQIFSSITEKKLRL
ncbi:hypothetical protein JD844_001751 [Phrynosoma platyrhinos]|uniref:long-chain-fatty-acid--CoA ligase n=1 Tax=Phrynosoma platyrhinos TaxID=52577 RepID=A0ABQ7TB19_PHRPL|nr:hypothetical protein JD844_001751 [Phrynosoma platyrhinos]